VGAAGCVVHDGDGCGPGPGRRRTKVTANEHVPPGATLLAEQVSVTVLNSEASAPVMVAEVTVKGEPPVLASGTVRVPVVPTAWSPKVSAGGSNATAGPALAWASAGPARHSSSAATSAATHRRRGRTNAETSP
jgi:hypothetical protein